MTLSYSVATAASSTGLSPTQIKRAIHTGALKAKMSGRTEDGEPTGKYVILAADLEAYLGSLVDA